MCIPRIPPRSTLLYTLLSQYTTVALHPDPAIISFNQLQQMRSWSSILLKDQEFTMNTKGSALSRATHICGYYTNTTLEVTSRWPQAGILWYWTSSRMSNIIYTCLTERERDSGWTNRVEPHTRWNGRSSWQIGGWRSLQPNELWKVRKLYGSALSKLLPQETHTPTWAQHRIILN